MVSTAPGRPGSCGGFRAGLQQQFWLPSDSVSFEERRPAAGGSPQDQECWRSRRPTTKEGSNGPQCDPEKAEQ